LMMRARSWTLRDGFADVLRGLHIREEVEDYTELPSRSLRATSAVATASGIRPGRGRRVPSAAQARSDGNGWDRPRFTAPAVNQRVAVKEVSGTATVAGIAPPGNEASGPAPTPATIESSSLVLTEQGRDSGAKGHPEASGLEISCAAHITIEEAKEGEAYTLVDAEGCFTEVTGAAALRSAFERLFDPQLSPDQIAGLWESNPEARAAIERRFGGDALEEAVDRVRAAERAREEQRQSGTNSKKVSGRVPRRRNPHKSQLERRSRRSPGAPPDVHLLVDPGWPEARVFRHYHDRLRNLQDNGSGKAAAIIAFREANHPIEARLRSSLPHLIHEIDAIYAWAAKHAR